MGQVLFVAWLAYILWVLSGFRIRVIESPVFDPSQGCCNGTNAHREQNAVAGINGNHRGHEWNRNPPDGSVPPPPPPPLPDGCFC